MAITRLKDHSAAPPWDLLAKCTACGLLFIASAITVNAQDAQSDKNESWTATSENSQSNATPSRTMESHSKSGNRSVDKQRLDVRGPNGEYRPDSETETETIRVDGNTTRTVVRTYSWDENGRRILSRQSEQESHKTSGGDSHVVRTTSDSDLNGHLKVVQREVSDTRQTSPDTQETKTTVYATDSYGGLTAYRQEQATRKSSADHTVEEKKTTLIPDGNGNFKVGEVREKTTTENGATHTSDERVQRPDLDGKLSEFSRTVSDETEDASGGASKTVDTYSTQEPGFTGDGRLHHNQRITTVRKKEANGEIIEQQIEAPNPGNPTDHPLVQGRTKYTVRYAASGTEQTKTTQTRDANGNLNVASTETKKSDQPPPAPPPAPPSQQSPPPKPN